MTSIRRLLALAVLVTFASAFLTACQSANLPPLRPDGVTAERRMVDFRQVQPILQSRCMACHSCLESPCQLNMQTWEGLRRGAFHENVYDGARLSAVEPTRLFEDATTEAQWRAKGFVDVLSGDDDSILVRTLRLSQLRSEAPSMPARKSQICPLTPEKVTTWHAKSSELAMPYGLPSLSLGEQELIAAWVASGAPGASNFPLGVNGAGGTAPTNPAVKLQIQDWERFLNAQDLRSRIVARYFYEHLFLAHPFFRETPRDFFKLVRSSTACEQGVQVISTRRPNDDPGVPRWYYCFYRDPAAIVYKNHLPYELSPGKLAWMKENFLLPEWRPTQFPSFAPEIASNPFLAYSDIPIAARYKFLLANADYEVMTFIKGPVCNGSFAVNSIQEQFYVFFTNPATDLMVIDPEYARKVATESVLPGSLGGKLGLGKIVTGYENILKNRSIAREVQAKTLAKDFPKGIGLDNIWDGDGTNDNAVLTVFRHNDNAKVVKGAKGDTAKTAFVLDYSTFERLVYNLAINFDVYENLTHQLLTRLYMDILRMDAEDNFLQFLPEADRIAVKQEWYKGTLTRWKIDLLDEKKFAPVPTRIVFESNLQDKKTQLLQKIIFERLNARVRGPDDRINWKTLKIVANPDRLENELKSIASVKAGKGISPFPNYFPEFSVLLITERGQVTRSYSILRNREHENLSWILNENNRLSPEEDTLTILPGILGAYPNQFFLAEEAQVAEMVEHIRSLRSPDQYRMFARQYGVYRMNPSVWTLYDAANGELSRLEPVEAGMLDLSRYSN